MTATEHGIMAWVALPGDIIVELDVISAQITLDEAWAPYGQATLVCKGTSDAFDPRDELTVAIFFDDDSRAVGHPARVFGLGLRTREIDYRAGTTTLTCATDERRLMDICNVTADDDDSYLVYQNSLRDIVDAVLFSTLDGSVETPYEDADLTIYSDSTNLITNPGAEVNTNGWTAVGCTMTRFASAVVGVVGSYVYLLSSPATDNNYIYTVVNVTPGETYVFSANFYANGTPTGSPHSLARRIAITNNTTGTVLASSDAGPLGASEMYRLWGEVTIPAGVTAVRVRLYGGYPTTEDIRWDAVKFAVKDGSSSDHTYFSGDTTDTATYSYAWTGTAHDSESTRTNLTGIDRTQELFTWRPGMSAWDFLEPLVQASGLRLFCDEGGLWRLIDPATYTVAGTVEAEAGATLTDAFELVDRGSDEWFDAVVVKYSWTTKAGISKVRYDVAGTGTKARLVEYNRPWPGAGAAAAMLARAETRGRVMSLSAVSDQDVTPGQECVVTAPGADTLTGVVAAVTWRLPEDEMSITPRALIEEEP